MLTSAERELHEALAVQERSLAGMYVEPWSEANAAFERAARAVCGEAHRLSLRAEEMLVVVKHAWSRLAMLRARQLGDRDDDVLREVVSLSIEVYFESMTPAPMERAPSRGVANARDVTCRESTDSLEAVMPGYRSLSSHISGAAAEHAREAEAHQRGGDAEAASRLLEEALEASLRVRPELPGWVCGRLASIYRTLKRYDDEVALLERYRDSQTSEEARNRFDARLSKARAIADRKRRSDTGALATVRQVRVRSSQRRRTTSSSTPLTATRRTPQFAPGHLYALREALLDTSADGPAMMHSAMSRLCADARTMDQPMESLVAMLKTLWAETPVPPSLSREQWQERYAAALVDLLAMFFGESAA